MREWHHTRSTESEQIVKAERNEHPDPHHLPELHLEEIKKLDEQVKQIKETFKSL